MKKILLSLTVAVLTLLLSHLAAFGASTRQGAPPSPKTSDLAQVMSLYAQLQQGQRNNVLVPTAQTTAPQPQPAPLPQVTRPAVKRGEVSFNFDDADVFSVIQTIFGDILKVNYIVDPSVKGRVTFRSVAPVPKEDVLPLMEVILRLSGIGIVEEGGLYRIVPIADIAKEPAPVGIGRDSGGVRITGKAVLQVVPIRYIQSSEIVRILTPFLSKNAVMIDVPKSNYIIIVDTDTNVKRLLQLVEIFDSEQLKRIKPEVFVYPVQNGKAKDVAALLQQIFLGAKAPPAARPAAQQRAPTAPGQPPAPTPVPQPAGAGPEGGEALVAEITKIFADEVTNTIIILATPEDYELIAETVQKIDIVPRQVVIETLVARVNLTDNMSFGFRYRLVTDLNISGLWPFTQPINLSGDTVFDPGSASSPSFTFLATDPSGIARAEITAALTKSQAKVLAAPHILVADNREARIQVGQQVPLATSATTTPLTGGVTSSITQTSTIQYKDIGIILRVKPQVNDSGLVNLEITQEVSSLGGNVVAGGTENVSIDKTEATTNMVVQDGQTIIIGGLIREDVTKGKTGIPFLSEIPFIGFLFSNTSTTTARTEVVILITPHVIRTQKDAVGLTSDYVNKFRDMTQDKRVEDFIEKRGLEKRPYDPDRTLPSRKENTDNSQ